MTKADAQDLLENPAWQAFLKVTFNELKTNRAQLLVARDLTQENRLYYAGQVQGVYQVLRRVYEAAEIATSDIPLPIRAFFKGDFE